MNDLCTHQVRRNDDRPQLLDVIQPDHLVNEFQSTHKLESLVEVPEECTSRYTAEKEGDRHDDTCTHL
jgi:hypothetical protein